MVVAAVSAARWMPGTPWKEWAERAYPNGWLAVGGPKGGELLKAGRREITVAVPAEARATFWEVFAPQALTRPDDLTIVRHVYRHEKLSFPPALWWHVYVHESLTMEQAQTALFYRLLANEPGVEDVREVVSGG